MNPRFAVQNLCKQAKWLVTVVVVFMSVGCSDIAERALLPTETREVGVIENLTTNQYAFPVALPGRPFWRVLFDGNPARNDVLENEALGDVSVTISVTNTSNVTLDTSFYEYGRQLIAAGEDSVVYEGKARDVFLAGIGHLGLSCGRADRKTRNVKIEFILRVKFEKEAKLMKPIRIYAYYADAL